MEGLPTEAPRHRLLMTAQDAAFGAEGADPFEVGAPGEPGLGVSGLGNTGRGGLPLDAGSAAGRGSPAGRGRGIADLPLPPALGHGSPSALVSEASGTSPEATSPFGLGEPITGTGSGLGPDDWFPSAPSPGVAAAGGALPRGMGSGGAPLLPHEAEDPLGEGAATTGA